MELVTISGNRDDLQEFLLKLTQIDYVHPELASQFTQRVHGLTNLSDDNPYLELINQFSAVIKELGASEADLAKIESGISSTVNEEEVLAYVKELKGQIESYNQVIEELHKVKQEDEDVLVQVNNVRDMDINFDDIFSLKYLDVRYGRLPIENVEKIAFHKNRPFVFKEFQRDKNYVWCLYMTTTEYAPEIDNIFSLHYFERIFIPDFVHGSPEEVIVNMQGELEGVQAQLDDILKRKEEYIESHREKALQLYKSLCEYSKTYDVRKYIAGWRNHFSFTGFVPVADKDKLLSDLSSMELDIEFMDPKMDDRLTPPSKLKNNWFARPFEMFVTIYGYPNYGDIDPTPFVALTYSLLFGIMFGDLGQGLVLMIVGQLMWKLKKMKLGAIGVRIGFFSALFGFFYGSVFGNEELLTPILTRLFNTPHKPIEVLSENTILPLMIMTLVLGIVLIVCSMSINIITQIRKKNMVELVCSQNALSGLTFYLAILGGSIGTLLGHKIFSTPYILGLIILPLILMFLKEAFIHKSHGGKMFPNGFGGYVMESFFEVFEIVLSFLTNSISFLRVSGFVLSHAGMMMVVTLLAGTTINAQYIIVMIIGNIFVMCLEGLIVGIQALRLEFYEMFSRYYEGAGVPFQSINSKDA